MTIGPQKQPASVRQIEAQTRQVSRELSTCSADGLLAAVKALLPLVEEDRRAIIETNSQLTLVGDKIRPIPDTLEPDVAEHVARYDQAITLAYKALGIT